MKSDTRFPSLAEQEARQWIASTPRPTSINRARSPGAEVDDNGGLPESSPDAEVVRLALAEVESSGGKLTYFAAQTKVLRGNPELAERYRHMPGIKDS